MSTSSARNWRVAVIGAGPGGLCMGIRLAEAGIEDFVILEKAAGVGGTWFHNRYPGCACDVPSHLYSYSFELKADWSRPYAPQPEILGYFEECAEKYGLLPHCRFDTEVVGAKWDDRGSAWIVELAGGERLEADVVVGAVGMFNEPVAPHIPGLSDFAGPVIHSARWDGKHELAEETVGVIGSAASAVQLVPVVVEEARQLHVFQRSANWVLPKQDTPYTTEEIDRFRTDPDALAALRRETYANFEVGSTFRNQDVLAEREAAVLQALEVVEDPVVREKLRPTHPFGCKRPLFSNDYFAAFNRPDLELVTDEITAIRPRAVVTADGTEREVDTLILATGFATTKYLSTIDVVGRDGRHLDDAWHDGPEAYVGITTSGFPNLFMLYGPNTNNGSIITMLEHQVDHVIRQLDRMEREELAWIDVRPEAMRRYNTELQEEIESIEVWHAGCNGYYRGPTGRIVTQWPSSMAEYGRRTSTIDRDAFEVAPLVSS